MRTTPRSLAMLAGLLLAVTGCSLDVSRTRVNNPLDQTTFRGLEPGRTTLEETLAKLGAPDKVESKPDKDWIWYLHEDTTRVGVRLESPISFFGYRHTFAELDVDSLDTNSMRLVFDSRTGLLQDKSLRLAPAYSAPQLERPPLSFLLLPRAGFAPIVFGDAGEESYGKLFSSGRLFGGYLGLATVPFFTLLLGGNFQDYTGDSFHRNGTRVAVDDLRLYQVEAGGRFELPPAFFVSFWDIDKLKEIFYSEDMRRRRGFLIYFQWTLGGTFNEGVGVEINGARRGTWFDRGFGLSTATGLGLEYVQGHLGASIGIEYQLIDAFNGGNAPLDTDAGSFQSFVASGSIFLRF